MPKKEPVTEITSSEFSKFIIDKKAKLVVIDFFTEWCEHCKTMESILESLAQKNPEVKFRKINVENARRLAQKYEISDIPCIIFFKDGKEIGRSRG